MKAHQLELGKCYIHNDGNGGTIYDVEDMIPPDGSEFGIKYKRMFEFSSDLSQISVEENSIYYVRWYEDSFELCDVTLLDKIIKLYNIFRASAKPLIKQVLTQES